MTPFFHVCLVLICLSRYECVMSENIQVTGAYLIMYVLVRSVHNAPLCYCLFPKREVLLCLITGGKNRRVLEYKHSYASGFVLRVAAGFLVRVPVYTKPDLNVL
jgi:hypothetical protein